MKKLLIATFLVAISTNALADNVVITTTKGWKSYPIKLKDNNTYEYIGTFPTDNEYYFTTDGYRCFNKQMSFNGVESVVYTGNSGPVYCYAD